MDKPVVEKAKNTLVFETAKKIINKYGIVIALVVIVAFFALWSENFFTPENILNLLRQISIKGIIGIGMAFVILCSGVDLSVGSNTCLCGILVAMMVQSGQNMFLAMLVSLLVGLLFGTINGFFIAKCGMTPFIVTLATSSVGTGLVYVITEGKPISKLSEQFTFIGRGALFSIPIPVIIMAGVYVVAFVLLSKTVIGRRIYAVGGNERTAIVSGINSVKVKIFAHAFCGLLCGLAGIVLTARVTSASVNAATGYESDAIASCVIGGISMKGGKGSLFGALIGILIIGTISNGMDIIGVGSYHQKIVMGGIILLAVQLDLLTNRNR